MDVNSIYDNMTTVTGSSSGVWFTEGLYEVELTGIDHRPNGHKGHSCIFQFKVLGSNRETHPVGSSRVWIVKLDGKKDQQERAYADIKNMVFALTGIEPKSVGDPSRDPDAKEQHKEALGLYLAAIDKTFATKHKIDPEALFGNKALLECQTIKTKSSNYQNDFTKHVWGPAEDDSN